MRSRSGSATGSGRMSRSRTRRSPSSLSRDGGLVDDLVPRHGRRHADPGPRHVLVRAIRERSARVAESALQLNLRPLLFPSHDTDRTERFTWVDKHWAEIRGGRGWGEIE